MPTRTRPRSTRPESTTAEIVQAAFTLLGFVAAVVAIVWTAGNSDDQLAQENERAFFYDGGQLCTAYREQVLDLYDRGLTAVEIERIFDGEKGVTDGERLSEDEYKIRANDKEDLDQASKGQEFTSARNPYNCGAVSALLAAKPRKNAP